YPHECEIAHVYKTDRTRYEANCRAWTREYAMVSAGPWHLEYYKEEIKDINGRRCNVMICKLEDSGNTPCGKSYAISHGQAIIHLMNCHDIYVNKYGKNFSKLLYTIMDFPTYWDYSSSDTEEYEKIRLTQDEQNLIRDLKSILCPFLEIAKLLRKGNHYTYSLINPALLEIKNKFYLENVNTVEINFEDKELNFNTRIQIDEPVNCAGLIDKINHTLSAAIDHYWKVLSDPELILYSLLDPRIKRLSFVSTSKRYAVEDLLRKKYREMKSTMETENDIDRNRQSQRITSSILANLKKPSSPVYSDEVTEYLLLEEIDLESNPFMWWKERKENFPILYSFAMKYLSVYTTSTVNEKLFSDANNLIDKENSHLFKYKMFLKQYNKNLESINSRS
ncbi:2540_t:CDS:2, partial [Rhizophagus irregularis]